MQIHNGISQSCFVFKNEVDIIARKVYTNTVIHLLLTTILGETNDRTIFLKYSNDEKVLYSIFNAPSFSESIFPTGPFDFS